MVRSTGGHLFGIGTVRTLRMAEHLHRRLGCALRRDHTGAALEPQNIPATLQAISLIDVSQGLLKWACVIAGYVTSFPKTFLHVAIAEAVRHTRYGDKRKNFPVFLKNQMVRPYA